MADQHAFTGQGADGHSRQHNGHVYNGNVTHTINSTYTTLPMLSASAMLRLLLTGIGRPSLLVLYRTRRCRVE